MAISPPHKRGIIDLTHTLAISSSASLLLGMRLDEILVFGHTHKPFIIEDKVINSGSWVNEVPDRGSQNSYVKIDDGKTELKYYNRNDDLL